MNVNKIFFLSKEEDIESLNELSENFTFDIKGKNALAEFVWHDGNIIVSLNRHEDETIIQDKKDLEFFGYVNEGALNSSFFLNKIYN